jgi:type II secretory pathway pseudopilin PulG
MKSNPPNLISSRRSMGFTIAEMMIVMATLAILTAAVISANLFGLSMQTRSQIWLSASDDAGQIFGKVMNDVRSAYTNKVGSGSVAGFTNCSPTNWQQGNALMCYQQSSSGVSNGAWVMYFYDPRSSNIFRTNWTSTNCGELQLLTTNNVMTNNIYNSNIFSVYNSFTGMLVPETNQQGREIIQICLAFSKLQNPEISIAPGNPVDFYQIISYAALRSYK